MPSFNMPTFNVGRTVYQPGMNPSIRLPGGYSMSTPGMSTVPGNMNATMAPIPDYHTTYGLTPNWGKLDQPITAWYNNPSPFVQTLNSTNSVIKNLQPVIPINPADFKPGWNTFPGPQTQTKSFAPTTVTLKPVAPLVAPTQASASAVRKT